MRSRARASAGSIKSARSVVPSGPQARTATAPQRTSVPRMQRRNTPSPRLNALNTQQDEEASGQVPPGTTVQPSQKQMKHGGFKIMGLDPSPELLAIAMGKHVMGDSHVHPCMLLPLSAPLGTCTVNAHSALTVHGPLRMHAAYLTFCVDAHRCLGTAVSWHGSMSAVVGQLLPLLAWDLEGF